MLNEDILIDRNALEDECSRAPGFFDYWQTQEANLKVDLENHEAQMSKEIRGCEELNLKDKYGISKITEGAITAVIKTDLRYRMLKRQHLQAEANRKSYEKKIALLDTLAKLHGQGYFSRVESKKEVRTMMAKTVRDQIAKQIKARKLDKSEKPQRPER